MAGYAERAKREGRDKGMYKTQREHMHIRVIKYLSRRVVD
jgi:hypothetical protein